MKKFLLLFSAIFIFGNVFAEEYLLWVNEQRITSENCNDILGDGRVSYVDSTQTLTLDSATINTVSYEPIASMVDNLKIVVKGHCTFNIPLNTERPISGIDAAFGLTIVGSGPSPQLDIIRADSITEGTWYGFEVGIHDFVIESGPEDVLEVNIINSTIGIRKSRNGNMKFIVRNARFNILNCTGLAILFLGGLTLEGCEILYPEGAHFDNTKMHFLGPDGNDLKGDLMIGPATTGIELVGNAQSTIHDGKFIRDGQIYIRKDDRTFNILGTEVR